jgi:hypothetical protein
MLANSLIERRCARLPLRRWRVEFSRVEDSRTGHGEPSHSVGEHVSDIAAYAVTRPSAAGSRSRVRRDGAIVDGTIELAPITSGSFGGWLTTDVTPGSFFTFKG